MADVLFSIAESILMNLGSRAVDEIACAWGFNDGLEKLKHTINTLKDVLLDAEKQPQSSFAVRGWLERLKAAVFEADDMFDELATVAAHKEVMGGSKFSKEVRIFFSNSNRIALAFEIARKIKRIREDLDEIVKNSSDFGFMVRPHEERLAPNRQRDQTYSFVEAGEVIGRDYDKKAIVDILLASSSQECVSVVPIVGIEGLGKTTLAQLVFNDENIVSHFELRLWVCVSEMSDIKQITRKILMSATNAEPLLLEMDQLQSLLRKEVAGKKYLLVLDDVWNENREEWLELSALLKSSREGSKILVTTQSREVAEIMGTIPPYELEGLSEDKSWTLFKRVAFEPGQDSSSLVKVGKEIVKKCANVPLAIRTLGSRLYGKDEGKWLHYKDISLVDVSEKGNDFMSVLRQRYHHLCAPLKNCFSYCSLFPKKYEFDKETLISLWMAEGFLIPKHANQSLEEAGEEYFSALLQRGFFQDIRKDKWGKLKSCKMHDLMHDLAQKVAGVESKIAMFEETNFDKRIHHLSFGYSLTSSSKIPSWVTNLKLLRTLLLPKQVEDGSEFSTLISNQLISSNSFRHLRVLDLHNLGVQNLTSSFGKLIHLRYLDLSRTPIVELPDKITQLHNLQTLNLSGCYKLKWLPSCFFRKLTNLRRLDVTDCDNLIHMPSGIGGLTSLCKLTQFVVNHKYCPSSSRFKHTTNIAQLRDLKTLNNLRGMLWIKIFGEIKDPVFDAKEANLSNKRGLTELRIEGDSVSGNEHDEGVLEGLKPHPNLKKLQIDGYNGRKLPSWANMDNLCTCLPNLIEIELGHCKNWQKVPSFSQLPFLKCLTLRHLESVEYICRHPSSSQETTIFFPSLQELTLMNMDNLKGWWEKVGDVDHLSEMSFPKLSKLQIENCPKLTSMPFCPKVVESTIVNVNENLLLLKMAASSDESCSKLVTLGIDNVEVCRRLPSLDILQFKNFHNLTSLSNGLQHLTKHDTLVISNCKHLDFSPNGQLDDGMPWKSPSMLAVV